MDRKTEILETALRLFLRHGYENCSMRMLAEELGVTKPAIYHYFPGKEALALEVVNLFSMRTTEWVERQMAKITSFDAYLRFFFASIPVFAHIERVVLPDAAHETFTHSFNDFITALSAYDDVVRLRMGDIMRKTRDNLAEMLSLAGKKGVVRSDFDVEAMAFLLHAVCEGAAVLFSYEPDMNEERISENMHKIIQQYLKPLEETCKN